MIESSVGIDELIHLYKNPCPNPFYDRLILDEKLIGQDYILYDIQGNILQRGVIRQELDLIELAEGVYVVQVLFTESINFRIVKG